MSGTSRVGAALLALAATVSLLLVGVDGARWSQAPPKSSAPPVTLQGLLEEGSQQRHSLYAFLRVEAPGATIILDANSQPPVGRLSLRSLAGSGPVEHRSLPAGWLPDGPPDQQGLRGTGAWEAHREPGDIDTILVGSRDGRVILVDRRSVPALAVAPPTDVVPPSAPPTLLHAVVVETAVLIALVLLGGLVLPRRAGVGLLRPALALLAGAATQATGAYFFLAGPAAMATGTIVAIAVGLTLRRGGHQPGWRREDMVGILVASGTIGATVVGVRLQGLVLVTADSVAHISRAIGMAGDGLGLADLNEKRPLAGAAIHAPAHALGAEGLHALGWALLLAAIAVLVTLPQHRSSTGRTSAGLVLGVTVIGMAVLAQPLVRALAAFVNTHVLVGVLLLLLVVLWVAATDEHTSAAVAPAGAIALLALIPTRAEAVLLVGLVLLATLAARTRDLPWAWAWPAVGAGLTVWNGFHVIAALHVGGQPSFPVSVLTGVGLLTLAAGPVAARLPENMRRILAATAMVLLWTFVTVLLLRGIGADGGALRGLQVNLGAGEGAWGVFAPLIVAVTALTVVVGTTSADRRLLLPRWLVLGAVPSVLIAKAADGSDRITTADVDAALAAVLSAGARIGSWGDSANRMWIHFLFVALALIVLTVIVLVEGRPAGRAGPSGPSLPVAPGGRAAGVAVGVTALAVAGSLLVAWQPTYLGPASPGSAVPLRSPPTSSSGPDAAGVELPQGMRVEWPFSVPALTLPDDADDVEVCVGLRFTDGGRTARGVTRFGVDGPDGSTTSDAFGEFAWEGERSVDVCLPAPELTEAALPVTVWVAGGPGASRGSAALLVVDGADPVERLEVRYVAASEDPRGRLQQIASVGLRAAIRWGPAGVGLLVAVGFALLGASARSRVRPGGQAG